MTPKLPTSPFVTDVAWHVAADDGSRPMRTLTEARVRLGLVLLQLENVIERPGEMSRSELAREQLVRIAATAWLAALQLGLESRGDAIGRDIPF